MAKSYYVELSFDERARRALELLARSIGMETADDAVAHLAASAIDGVYRPGAWEREWLHPVFGSEWEDQLEQDPDVNYPAARIAAPEAHGRRRGT